MKPTIHYSDNLRTQEAFEFQLNVTLCFVIAFCDDLACCKFIRLLFP